MIPHNLDAEADVLAAALQSAPDRAVALTTLVAEDFYGPLHAKVFVGLLEVVAEGRPVDATIVAERAGVDRKQLVGLIGRASPIGVKAKAAIVAEHGARRRMLTEAQVLRADALDLGVPFPELLTRWTDAPDRIRAPEVEPIAGAEITSLVAGEQSEFVIEDVLRRRERVVITGNEGLGKSEWGRCAAMFTAAGRHLFTGQRVKAHETLLVDLENESGDIGDAARRIASACGYKDGCHAKSRPQGMDLMHAKDARWLESLVAYHEPALVVIGPLYKMYRGSEGRSKASEEAAEHVAAVLDDLRVKFDCALWIEAHAPHGEHGSREGGRPRGSALWLGWPNFGLWMKRHDSGVIELRPWRGARHRGRSWPWGLREGQAQPFETVWEKPLGVL